MTYTTATPVRILLDDAISEYISDTGDAPHYRGHLLDLLEAAVQAEPQDTDLVRTPGTVEVDGVVAEIARERIHQIQDNGFDAKHDDTWTDSELVNAAICYVQSDFDLNRWPWDEEWWKDKGERQNLIRGIALLVAEVERRDRAALTQENTNDAVQ